MPYNIKVVRGESSKMHRCDYLEVKTVPEDSPAAKSGLDTPGVKVELATNTNPGKPASMFVVRLPEDGDSLYVMSERGDTLDAYHWPLRKARAS